jgi:hypothetical protein
MFRIPTFGREQEFYHHMVFRSHISIGTCNDPSLPLLAILFEKKKNLFCFDVVVAANGILPAQIRRAGKWNDDCLTNAYLSQLPRDFMRKVAGHVHQGRYFVDRAQVTPPEELLCQIFPDAVKDLDCMKKGHLPSESLWSGIP